MDSKMAVLQFITNPQNNFIGQTFEYLRICGFSIAIAMVIGVVLGAAVSRNALLAFIAVNLSGMMRAIPIIAVLIAFVPFFGLGFKPTVIALVVLGIPPILLNTYTGLRGIDPAIIDAAKGMGMDRWQIAMRIQAPLVTPLVAAGIRTAAVQVVATATLAAFIGAGGYGDYIVDGLTVFNYPELIAGSISVAVLAMLIEVLMSWLQKALTPAGLRIQEQAAEVKP
jgi:osmoprotectant transport system permease protein